MSLWTFGLVELTAPAENQRRHGQHVDRAHDARVARPRAFALRPGDDLEEGYLVVELSLPGKLRLLTKHLDGDIPRRLELWALLERLKDQRVLPFAGAHRRPEPLRL